MSSSTNISKILIAILCVTNLVDFGIVADRYNTQELDALEKFRPLVESILYQDYMKKDHYLIRWLRARDLDVPQARSMLGKALRWRRENNIDTILNETIPTLPTIPYYLHDAFSYAGNPVSTINVRALEIRKWISAGKRAELLRFMDQAMEFEEAGVRFLGDRLPFVRQIIAIIDFNGYSQRQHGCLPCISVYHEWTRHYENYYPQLCKYIIYVNTPRIVQRLFNAVRPLLSTHTQKVFIIFGENKEQWRRKLLKIVPRNQLRRNLGGTKPDHLPCAVQDFACTCRVFFKSARKGTNTTTIRVAAGVRKLDTNIC